MLNTCVFIFEEISKSTCKSSRTFDICNDFIEDILGDIDTCTGACVLGLIVFVLIDGKRELYIYIYIFIKMYKYTNLF